MNRAWYSQITDKSLNGELLTQSEARDVLESPDAELLSLIDSAYQVRKKFYGKEVRIHIINNGQNGWCPEDCHYCAQAKSSQTNIEEYPLKSDAEFLAEAKAAYEKGAFRYCMVFAGRGPSIQRINHLARLIKEIKSRYPIQVCVSAGLLNEEKAKILKEAGLDRLNHNLNTSEKHYPSICTTHTFQDRLNTLQAARSADIKLCSGIIVGMGEGVPDIAEVAFKLRELKVESIPVNLYIPVKGNTLSGTTNLTPEFCLRVLCLFRLLNPSSEIRVAAGRELHLRDMEVLALYPANSLFLGGYLNVSGEECARTLQMIRDAGFSLTSEIPLDEVLSQLKVPGQASPRNSPNPIVMKDIQQLRPHLAPSK